MDRAGLVRHRDIGDLMRYGALNQDADVLSRYAGFRPVEVFSDGKLPDPATLGRYSDEQLYALASYIYSLPPPPNPNRSDPFAARGHKVFEREGCAGCHTPPLNQAMHLTVCFAFRGRSTRRVETAPSRGAKQRGVCSRGRDASNSTGTGDLSHLHPLR